MIFLIPILMFFISKLILIVPVCLGIILALSITKGAYRGAKNMFIKRDPNAVIEHVEPLSNSFGIKFIRYFGGFGYRIVRKIIRRLVRSSPALSAAVDHGFDYAASRGINDINDVVDGAKNVAKGGVTQAQQGIQSATNKISSLTEKAQGAAKNLIDNPEEAQENVKTFAQSVKSFFGNIIHKIFAKPEGDNLDGDSLPQGATAMIAQGLTNTSSMISHALSSSKRSVGNAAKKIENGIENTINNTAELKHSVSAWKSIDWNTGDGILPAIQATAEGCSSGFGLLKKLPGGKYLTGRDLRAASFVAAKFFPPAAIAMEAGRVVLNTGGRISDITDVTKRIYNNVITRHYLKASYGAFELFKIMAFNSGAKKQRVVE